MQEAHHGLRHVSGHVHLDPRDLSLIGIGSGLIVLFGMFGSKRLDGMTALFLATTALTSLTGLGFPFEHVTPGIILAILSLIVLAVAIPGR